MSGVEQGEGDTRGLQRWHTTIIQLLGARSAQQDAWAVDQFLVDGEPALAVALADGHGDRGAEAAQDVVRGVVADAQCADRGRAWLEQEFLRLHKRVLTFAEDEPSAGATGAAKPSSDDQAITAGTTLTFLLLHREALLVAYVGDTQARLARRDGALKTLTIPHRYGVHHEETRRLDDTGANIAEGSHIRMGSSLLGVTRALGDGEFAPFVIATPEIHEQTLAEDTRFLIVATDGLWDKLARATRRHRVERILRQAVDVQDATAKIRELIAHWRFSDNTTMVIVDLRRRAHRKSAPAGPRASSGLRAG